jgi:uncharacterized protein YjcR
MAHDTATRAKVRAKYVQGLPLATAAEVCGVSYNTTRNWKRDDAASGDDWDVARNARRMTKSGVEAMANEVLGELAEQFLVTIDAVKKDKAMSAQQRAQILVQLMDGYNKAIQAASRAMPNANRLATAMDVSKFLVQYIGQHAPKMREPFIALLEQAGPEFVREFGNGA